MDKMKNIKSICRICKYQINLQFHEMRTKTIFVLLFLYLGGMVSPIRDFAKYVGQGISPWIFPLLMNDMVCSSVIFCIWCFLICDIPFRNEGYLYYAGRAGKKNWICGEILFLFLYSGIYVLCIAFFLLVQSLPQLIFTAEWGKTLGTLAYTDAFSQFAIPFSFPPSLMSSVMPAEAMILSVLLVWSVMFLMGLTVLLVNWIGRVSYGVGFALFWILLDMTIYNLLDYQWRRFSPVSLTRITVLLGGYRYVTPRWALCFILGIVFVIISIILIHTKIRKGLE